jgi:hypothetical protein
MIISVAADARRERYAAAVELCAALDAQRETARWLQGDETAYRMAADRVQNADALYSRWTALTHGLPASIGGLSPSFPDRTAPAVSPERSDGLS